MMAFAIMSSHDALIKFLGGTYAVPQIVFFNAVFGVPLLLLSMRLEGNTSLIPRHPWWVAARTLAHIAAVLGTFYAFSVLKLTEVYAVVFAAPFVITALSIPILGERVGPKRWIAIGVGLIGVYLVLRPTGDGDYIGYIAAVIGMLGGATISLIMRRIGGDEANSVMMFYPMVVNVILMGATLPWLYQPMPVSDLGVNILTALMGFGAMTCLYIAYRKAPAAIVAPTQYTQIVWAAVFGFFFFDESIDPPTALGALIIIAAGAFVMSGHRKQSDSSATGA